MKSVVRKVVLPAFAAFYGRKMLSAYLKNALADKPTATITAYEFIDFGMTFIAIGVLIGLLIGFLIGIKFSKEV